jgi:GDP-L-fucose synthase
MELDSRIYVAGHRGLVGSAIVRRLKSLGYTKIIVDSKGELDLRHQQSTRNFIYLHEPDYVFLAAAKVGGINYNKNHPAEFIHDNLAIQNNVINSSYELGVKKLLFLGSSCIYPKICEQPIKEDALLTSPLEPTNEAYAIAKIAGLKMCQMYTNQYGFKTVSAMPANLYGPNDNFNSEQSHVIPAMIKKFLNANFKGEKEVTFFGDGSPIRDFMYVDDLADACIFLMNNYEDPSHINVGSGLDVSIKYLAQLIASITEYNGDIVWDESKPNGSPRRTLDTSRMDALGWYPKTSLMQGLVSTIDWYRRTGGEREL